MQISRSRTDLSAKISDIKQIFPDTARQPKPPAHIKEQTGGRISQTIVRIQSNQAKREFFPGIPVGHLDRLDAPAEKNIAWTEDISVSTSHIDAGEGFRPLKSRNSFAGAISMPG